VFGEGAFQSLDACEACDKPTCLVRVPDAFAQNAADCRFAITQRGVASAAKQRKGGGVDACQCASAAV
jgi:hypothetical protein